MHVGRHGPSILLAALLLAACAAPPVPDPAPLDPAPPGSFTLAAIPDTQLYVTKRPDTFLKQTRWITENLEEQRIAFVTHLGDIVERPRQKPQWELAGRAMKALDGRVPYGLTVGNHDVGRKGLWEHSHFSRVFPPERFRSHAWYGGDYPEGTNLSSYQLFEAAGMRFLVLHLICNAPDDVLDWARGVLERHQDRRAIIATHVFLGKDDGPLDQVKTFGEAGNSPRQIWEELLRHFPNVFLVLSGDQGPVQAAHVTLTGLHGNSVHACLSDYGDGSLRLYRFLPGEGRIRVLTFNVETGKLNPGTDRVPDRGEHLFDLAYTMEADPAGGVAAR